MHEAGRAEVYERLLTADAAIGLAVVGPPWSGRTATLEDAAEIAERRERPVVRINGADLGPEIVHDAGSAILVDDAHLLDEATLEALAEVSRDRNATDTWLVVSHASGALPRALAVLRQTLDTTVELAPLDTDEISSAVPMPEMVAALTEWTGGWAGLVAATTQPGEVPSTVAADVEGRLAVLDADARSVVEALGFGASADDDSLAHLSTLADPDEALARAAASLVTGPQLVPMIGAAVRLATPPARRRRLIELFAMSNPNAESMASMATHVADLGERSAVAGRLFQNHATSLGAEHSDEARRWFALATECGIGDAALDEARAALGAGDLDDALALLGSTDDDERLELLGHAFAQLGRRREATRWYGRASSPYGAIVSGEPPDPESWRADPVIEPLAVGLNHWSAGDAIAALDALGEAMRQAEQLEPGRLRPDTPHAATGLVATALLDHARAVESVDRATAADVGGPGYKARHQMIAAWSAMRAGRWDDADRSLAAIDTTALAPRDALVFHGVAAGLAVRTNRFDDLPPVLTSAVRALGDIDADSLDLALIAELVGAAARTHDRELTSRLLAQLDQLIERCGDGAIHHFQAAWARLLVDLADAASDVRASAAALAELELPEGPLHDCAAAAARFAQASDGDVDAEGVSEAAATLERHGLTHEAARLLGTAALRSSDEAATRELLKASRAMRSTRRRLGNTDVSVLSEREAEVAREVAAGRTHKEVGAALFISAKTVEHHVAKIRQKLGCANRAEMLASLATYFDDA